jgi:hypothetical protein
MNSKVILETSREGVARLRFPEQVDLSLGYHVWRLCGTLRADYSECLVDLCDTRALFDSGVAMLAVLQRRLAARGCRLSLVNCPADAEQRCRALGLCIDSTRRPAAAEVAGGAPYVCV